MKWRLALTNSMIGLNHFERNNPDTNFDSLYFRIYFVKFVAKTIVLSQNFELYWVLLVLVENFVFQTAYIWIEYMYEYIFIYIYIHIYIYIIYILNMYNIHICIYMCVNKWSTTQKMPKSHRSKMGIIS